MSLAFVLLIEIPKEYFSTKSFDAPVLIVNMGDPILR